MKNVLNTVDLFCGAGGATTGLELALKQLGLKHKGIAINHWKVAVDTMRVNHKDVETMQMSIESAIPSELVPSREVDLLWASPSCTHHSRAKGGKPRDNQLRAQPELILTWLDQLYVRRIIVENVPEFVEWGPVDKSGNVIKRLNGKCFEAWVNSLKARNYIVEWKIVNCANYGDATTRKRFFLKAVKNGCGKIRWPEEEYSHDGEEDLFNSRKKWKGIRECIDFSDTGKSIFNRRKPLAENTMRRIFIGLKKFCGLQFQMDMLGSSGNDACRIRTLDEPMATQHCSNRTALVTPFIVNLRRNETVTSIDKPINTITTSGSHHALCSAFILDHFRNGDAKELESPIGAQTTHDRFSLVTPLVIGQQGCATARPVTEPCPTIATAGAIRLITPIVLDDGRTMDVRIRMLKPSELAAAHSFPKNYRLTGTKTEQVKQIGNSVPVMTACAMCKADFE